MSTQAEKLYKEAGEFHSRAKAIMAEYEGKEMPQEKTNELDTLLDQCEAKSNEAKRLERTDSLGRIINEPVNGLGTSGGSLDEKGSEHAALEMKTFQKFLLDGKHAIYSEAERKTLRADTDTLGGFLVTPEQMVTGLLKAVDDRVAIRSVATVQQLAKAASLGVVSLDTDMNDADWTTELQTGSEDTALTLGKRSLTPHPLAKRTKISRTLLRNASKSPDSLVSDRMSYKFGVTQEKSFLTGDGAQKPLGLFTASAQGISTSRDITLAAVNAFTADELIDTKFFLKPQYQDSSSTRWLFHRDFLKRARKLKDGTGNYIWGLGLGGQPNTILDIPYIQSEFAPNTFTTGRYIALLGDMSFYWIVESLNLQIQVLTELYAETNENGYIGRMELDGMPVLEEAFVRMKLA